MTPVPVSSPAAGVLFQAMHSSDADRLIQFRFPPERLPAHTQVRGHALNTCRTTACETGAQTCVTQIEACQVLTILQALMSAASVIMAIVHATANTAWMHPHGTPNSCQGRHAGHRCPAASSSPPHLPCACARHAVPCPNGACRSCCAHWEAVVSWSAGHSTMGVWRWTPPAAAV